MSSPADTARESALAKAAPLFELIGMDPASPSERDDPIPVTAETGMWPDDLDELELYSDADFHLDGAQFLATLLEDATTDPEIDELLRRFHLKGTEAEGFEAYFAGGTTQALAELAERFGIGRSSAVCDLGCGTGWLAHCLDRLGFEKVTAMDTNRDAMAHLRLVAGERIDVIDDLDRWRRIRNRFDALFSIATVHHWDHIPRIALDARRTMKPGAHWFASTEWFADTPAEFLEAMTTHPLRSRYRMYEWAYPVSAYVDLIQSVGFALVAVVPLYYRRSALVTARPPTPPEVDQDVLDGLVDELLVDPNGTVELFWTEVDARRRNPTGGARLFTRPQVLVFRRAAVS